MSEASRITRRSTSLLRDSVHRQHAKLASQCSEVVTAAETLVSMKLAPQEDDSCEDPALNTHKYIGVAADNSVTVLVNSSGRSRCSTSLGKCVRKFLADTTGMDASTHLACAHAAGRIDKEIAFGTFASGLAAAVHHDVIKLLMAIEGYVVNPGESRQKLHLNFSLEALPTLAAEAVRSAQTARTTGGASSLASYVFEDLEPTDTESVLSRAIRDHAERLQRSFDIVWSESTGVRGTASPRIRSPAKAGLSSAKAAPRAPTRLGSISLRRPAASAAPPIVEEACAAAPHRALAVTRSDVSTSTQPGARVLSHLLERGISLPQRPGRECLRVQAHAAVLPSSYSGCEASPMSSGTPFASPNNSALAAPFAAAAPRPSAPAARMQQARDMTVPMLGDAILGVSLGPAQLNCAPPKRARGVSGWATACGSGDLDEPPQVAPKLPKIALPPITKARPQSDAPVADVT